MLTGNPISPALKYPSIGSIVSSQTTADFSREVPAYMDLTARDSISPGDRYRKK
jgi:hypothetical protein